jgi:hypothetical protein
MFLKWAPRLALRYKEDVMESPPFGISRTSADRLPERRQHEAQPCAWCCSILRRRDGNIDSTRFSIEFSPHRSSQVECTRPSLDIHMRSRRAVEEDGDTSDRDHKTGYAPGREHNIDRKYIKFRAKRTRP